MFKKFFKHLNYYKENYFYIPGALILCVLAIHFVSYLTGRAVVDDPSAIVGWIYNFIKAILIVSLTGLTKPHLFDDIDTTKENVSIWRVLVDSGETIFLLVFFGYLLSN